MWRYLKQVLIAFDQQNPPGALAPDGAGRNGG